MKEPYYRPDLARIHHEGFGFHADDCADGVLARLEPVRARDGLVLEFGCGSGLLTRYLVDAGLRVLATDASPAMLAIARETLGDRCEIRRLTLPDDPIPEADAIVGIGHALSYLDTAADIRRAVERLGDALLPGGTIVFDLCDLRWGAARIDQRPIGWVGEDWALVTKTSVPTPDRYVREMTTFMRDDDGCWRRDEERHDNILVDVAEVPGWLAGRGVSAAVEPAFGTEHLPEGLLVLVGSRPAS
jgi:SAM-dependent methyltransferase